MIAFFLSFALYFLTLSPSINFIDTDELATVVSKLGVAHPSGYPLYIVIGKLFTMIPIGDEVFRLNLMSALMLALTVTIFFRLILKLLNNTFAEKSIDEIQSQNVALASSLLLAFSFTFWDSATVLEVYPLHMFLSVLCMYLFFTVFYSNSSYDLKIRNGNIFALFIYLFALGFTNHLSIVFLIPGFAYLILRNRPIRNLAMNNLAFLLFLIFASLSLYFFLLVRSDKSILHWGDTNNISNLINHITGKDYEEKMFVSTENMTAQIKRFLKNFPQEFGYIHLILAPIGVYSLFRENRMVFTFTIITFLTCFLSAINYSIIDIFTYFLFAYIVVAIWCGFGIKLLVCIFLKNKRTAVSFASIAVILFPIFINFSRVNKSDDYFAHDYAMNVFKSAPENSIIFTSFTPSFYFQLVKGIRPDLTVINGELLVSNWYINHIKDVYTDVYEKSRKEFETYESHITELQNNKESYTNPKTEVERQKISNLQNSFDKLMRSIIDANIGERQFFTTYEIEQGDALAFKNDFSKDYYRAPHGLLTKYLKDSSGTSFSDPGFSYQISTDKDYFKEFVMKGYFISFVRQAYDYYRNSNKSEAEKFINMALKIYPTERQALDLSAKISEM